MPSELTRRRLLTIAGLAGVGAGITGCGPGRNDAAPSDESGGGLSPSSSPSSAAASPTSSPTGSASAGAGSSSLGSAPGSSTKPTFAQLAKQLHGELSMPGSGGFQPRNLLYNPKFFSQRPPQAIAHVRSSSDVVACVKFAAAGGSSLRIRNGGHSYGGWSSGQGLVVDLAAMNAVHVNKSNLTATVGAGALLADVYSELGAQGVSIGAGSCATVGVTGLSLGGGVGVLARAYGLTCDQLTGIQVVTADGNLRNVDSHTFPELFWALRGGGGSFGAVTQLTFKVKPAPRVQTFFVQWSWSAAHDVLNAWQHWMASAPRELWSSCKVLVDPGKGGKVLIVGTWIGSGSASTQLEKLLREVPATTPYYGGGGSYASVMLAEAGCAGESASACISGALQPAKRQPFSATSSIMNHPLPSAGIDALLNAVEAGNRVNHLIEGGASFDALGGAVNEVPSNATAFPWRSALADVQYTATWSYANAGLNPAPFDDYVRAERKALQPWLGTSAYVNYADPGLSDYANAYWGPNLGKLQTAKKSYDPHNLFTFPQQVPQ